MPDPNETPHADVRAQIGARIRTQRTAAGLSLSELARRAGIGKGTLSAIESGARNATVETIYALTGPLGIPMTAVIGESAATARADGGMLSTLLDVTHLADRIVEVFRLDFPPGSGHASPAHPAGATELLALLDGDLRAGPTGEATDLERGTGHPFAADQPHEYRSTSGAVALLVITTPTPAR